MLLSYGRSYAARDYPVDDSVFAGDDDDEYWCDLMGHYVPT